MTPEQKKRINEEAHKYARYCRSCGPSENIYDDTFTVYEMGAQFGIELEREWSQVLVDALEYIGHNCMNSETCPSREYIQAKARQALAKWRGMEK